MTIWEVNFRECVGGHSCPTETTETFAAIDFASLTLMVDGRSVTKIVKCGEITITARSFGD